jgi:allantoinase
MRFAIQSQRVVLTSDVRPAAVLIEHGTIQAVIHPSDLPSDIEVIDFGQLVIGPGLVDSHIHINEPGRTDWEGFATATQAAAAGGITTLIDMPLNSQPVTIDAQSLRDKRAAADGQCHVDVGFYGGLVPGNKDNLRELIAGGVLGVKSFLCDSGLPEFPATTRKELDEALPILAEANIPLLAHAEIVDDDAPKMIDDRSFAQFVASRPSRWEHSAIKLLIEYASKYNAKIHIVHLATSDAEVLKAISTAKRQGLSLTVETCPHYLCFAMEEIADGNPLFKCAPPIRTRSNRDGLRAALRSGLIDTIGSDHSPCLASMKHLESGDIKNSWGGISGVQFMLPAVFNALPDASIENIFRWLSARPAQLFGLGQRKGSIATGFDADIVIWDTDANWTATSSDILHKNGVSPYVGMQFTSQIHRTYLRGKLVYDREEGIVGQPSGELLRR